MTSSFASNCDQPGHAGEISKKEAGAGILPSHGISLDVPDETEVGRPPIVQHVSASAYASPLRHHRRHASEHRVVKETLDARSEYTNNEEDGRAEHRINQYIIKDEIGRGSFGAVHLAVDQYGKEYAVKEFSKARLRKRAQSNILRRPRHVRRPGHLAAGTGLNAPLHRHSASDLHNAEEQGNPLYLIKEEIAIMKKLNHPNLVSLIEVLDDPEEDSLYMVLEVCKKGVVMKVGLGEKADPYEMENCRCWFRDLVLGIEYLHAQGVVHRDIKPDNLLLTEDDVLKIVDFGVSEMFEKQSEMLTAKSAGSPAFLPPELCVTKHGDVSGRAADIWAMGVSLYCLRFGRIPFERSGVLELYDAIKSDEICIDPPEDPSFCNLLHRLLEKDPKKRITMEEIRVHPWVTKNGTDHLLPTEENTADLVEPPSEKEINHAITAKMRGLITLMKATKKFKSLLEKQRPSGFSRALGKGARAIHSTSSLEPPTEPKILNSKSLDIYDRRNVKTALATEGVHHDELPPDANQVRPMAHHLDSSVTTIESQAVAETPPQATPSITTSAEGQHDPSRPPLERQSSSGDKGHAHDPLEEEPLFLGVGTGAQTVDHLDSLEPPAQNVIAESPTAADFSIYDTAYQEEVDRIRASQGRTATVYLTRRVDKKKEYADDKNMVDAPTKKEVEGMPHEGSKGLLYKAREKKNEPPKSGNIISDLVDQAIANTRAVGREFSDRGGDKLVSIVQRAVERRWESDTKEGK